jgi:hypothetical protein
LQIMDRIKIAFLYLLMQREKIKLDIVAF